MRLLGIETSCDETAAAIIEAGPSSSPVTLLSNVISTSLGLHAKTGGIIPEVAARQQIEFIIPVIKRALLDAKLTKEDIDAIAITYCPGLIGSLLVGIETAKTLSLVWNKPIVPVNHLIGHIYANFISVNSKLKSQKSKLQFKTQNSKKISIPYPLNPITFPALALVVSGGHTDLVLMKKHGSIEWLGGTRDDAAGEAFDKIGRLLGYAYPAGPDIERLAKKGNPKAYAFPRPMIGSPDFDFSFSGLKTAVYRQVHSIKNLNDQVINDLCASAQQAIIDVLIRKTLKAAEKYNVKSILLSGGVAANETLTNQMRQKTSDQRPETKVFVPTKSLCTDNAAMIASAAFFNYKPVAWQTITADPEHYFD